MPPDKVDAYTQLREKIYSGSVESPLAAVEVVWAIHHNLTRPELIAAGHTPQWGCVGLVVTLILRYVVSGGHNSNRGHQVSLPTDLTQIIIISPWRRVTRMPHDPGLRKCGKCGNMVRHVEHLLAAPRMRTKLQFQPIVIEVLVR